VPTIAIFIIPKISAPQRQKARLAINKDMLIYFILKINKSFFDHQTAQREPPLPPAAAEWRAKNGVK
jgi:hypothetical protein